MGEVFAVLGRKRSKADFATTRFRLRASFFLLVQKETKDTLRGSASGSASAPKGGALLTVGPPPKDPRFTGAQNRCGVLFPASVIDTYPTHGGLRPFSDQTYRTSAPPMGAWSWCSSLWPAPLMVRCTTVPRPARRPGGCNSQSIRMQKPGGRRGNWRSRESRTPEREGRSVTERGVSRGSAPWTRSLGTFSGARESTSPAGARTGNP